MTFLGVGLAVALLLVGGFAVDLWRVLAARRSLAEVADSAAAAGANAIDLDRYRSTGEVRLDPDDAVALALEHVDAHPDGEGLSRAPRVAADADLVVVELHGEVQLTLLRLFTLAEPIRLTVTAEAVPVRGT